MLDSLPLISSRHVRLKNYDWPSANLFFNLTARRIWAESSIKSSSPRRSRAPYLVPFSLLVRASLGLVRSLPNFIWGLPPRHPVGVPEVTSGGNPPLGIAPRSVPRGSAHCARMTFWLAASQNDLKPAKSFYDLSGFRSFLFRTNYCAGVRFLCFILRGST